MRLSPLQKRILIRLDELERQIRSSGDKAAVKEVSEYGIPWSVTLLLGASPTPSESVSYCRSLKRMRDSGFVALTKWADNQLVSNVKLTAKGRKALDQQ